MQACVIVPYHNLNGNGLFNGCIKTIIFVNDVILFINEVTFFIIRIIYLYYFVKNFVTIFMDNVTSF